jgi:hypothetical protein
MRRKKMSMKRIHRAAAALLFALAMTASGSAPVLAGSADYKFEIVQQAVWSGSQPALTVRLIHVPSGKPVTDAEVFWRRLTFVGYNKGSTGWIARKIPLYADGQGNYRLFDDIPRGLGATKMKLVANVPNERGPILAQVTIERG